MPIKSNPKDEIKQVNLGWGMSSPPHARNETVVVVVIGGWKSVECERNPVN